MYRDIILFYKARPQMDEVVEFCETDKKTKRDLIVDPSALTWKATSSEIVQESLTMNLNGKEHFLLLSALRQAAEKYKIPPGYLIKCPAFLQEAQLNYWQTEYPSSIFLRLRERKPPLVRAFLSTRYQKLDNLDIVYAVKENSPYQLCFCWITEQYFILRIDVKNLKLPEGKEDLQINLYISNSETGHKSLTLNYYLRWNSISAIISPSLHQKLALNSKHHRMRISHISSNEDAINYAVSAICDLEAHKLISEALLDLFSNLMNLKIETEEELTRLEELFGKTLVRKYCTIGDFRVQALERIASEQSFNGPEKQEDFSRRMGEALFTEII